MPKTVKDLYDKHKRTPSWSRSISEIRDFSQTLQYVVSDYYTRVFIVIDALDECQDPRTLLPEIFKLQADTGANLFTTSRPIEEIKKQFEGSLLLEISATNEDVGKYLDGHMSQLQILAERNKELSEKIRTEIKTEIKTKIIKVVKGV